MWTMYIARLSTWLLLVSTMIPSSSADYPCICTYAVETPIYSTADTASTVIGTMFEFDCKPLYTDSTGTSSDWETVMADHQVGYIQSSNSLSKSTCQGSIPASDKVTTGPPTTPTTSTTTTTATTTTQVTSAPSPASTSTPAPSTGSTALSTKSPIAPSTSAAQGSVNTGKPTQLLSQPSTTAKPSSNATTPKPSSIISTTDMPTPSTTTTRMVTSAATTPVPTTTSSSTPTSTSVTSTTTSTTTVTPSTTTATTTATPSTTTATTPSTTSASTPSTTSTTTQNPTTHHISQHITNAPQISYKCPINVILAAAHNHGATRVYGSTCYEIVPGLYHWQDAEANCRNKGGHLVHINNMTEENHVMQFLYDQSFKHPVWLGLTDINSENHFHWTSGDPVTFTKWLPGHTSNFISHHYEDCVVLVPYIHTGLFVKSYGLWDDIACNLQHSWICQFNAETTPHFQGSGNNGHAHLHFTTKTPMIAGLGHIFDLIGRK